MLRVKSILSLATAGVLCAGMAGAQTNLTVETTGQGASNHSILVTLGEIASSEGIADFQFLSDQVLTNSLLNLARGQSDIVPTPLILPFLLTKGAGPYATVGAEEGTAMMGKVSALFTFSFGGNTLYSFDSSNVKGWGDLGGKKVLNGPPQGAALTNSRNLVQLVTGFQDGKDYQGVQSAWGQMIQTITDGSADAMVLPLYLPDPRMIQASASGSMTVYSVPKDVWEGEAMQNYLRSPGTGSFVEPIEEIDMPSGIAMSSEDDMIRMPIATGAIMVRNDMDEELAYKLTKAHLDNLETFKNAQPFMRQVGIGETDVAVTGMCGAVPVKFHPGAVRAYRDAGLTLPDCAIQ